MAEQSGANPLANALSAAPGDTDVVKRALQAVRSHLGMKVAYVSEIVEGRSVFREVDAPGLEAMVKPGDSYSLEDVYCQHILDGKLPELMPDTRAIAGTKAFAITEGLPIGAHMSVPIRLPDGRTYGMFCCLSFEPDLSLNKRDLQMMRAFADITAFEISRDLEAAEIVKAKTDRIAAAMALGQISTVYQPIYSLLSQRPVGFECLARFAAVPPRSPDVWFNEAAEVGLGPQLELAALQAALPALSALPGEVYLALNASPATMMEAEFSAIIGAHPPERIVLEVTEHSSVPDYDKLIGILQPLRQRGVRLAVDDAGAGYSSLRHILDLQPDLIKLDIGLTRNINLDPARRALASALIAFAHDTGSQIIAEGVETGSELDALRALGVEKAQGYFLGRPISLADAVALFRDPAQQVA